MKIDKIQDGACLTLVISGRMDTMTAPDVDKVIKDGLDDVKELVFDFKNLDYISSAGLRVLLAAQKIMNKSGRMVIRNAGESVMDVFEVTGFSSILTIE